jgi:nucleotide-binding universal stress UspA family protein
MKILLAIDGSPGSAQAVNEACRRAWPAGSEIKVLLVAEPLRIARPQQWVFTENYYVQLESTILERARLNAQTAVQQIRQAHGDSISVTSEVLNQGNPKTIILARAKDWKADLIIVGSHGWRGWQRRWLGSVSQTVASHAPCSVEIVRCRTAEAEPVASI